jgi:hypothetical protein
MVNLSAYHVVRQKKHYYDLPNKEDSEITHWVEKCSHSENSVDGAGSGGTLIALWYT